MRPRAIARGLTGVVLVAALRLTAGAAMPQTLNANDSHRVHQMLREAYDSVKKNYFDPTFHALDWDARYREYDEKLKSVPSLNGGLTVVAAFLDGLDDSHTYFMPPARPYRIDYGYRLAPVGDAVFVTRVRPGTDAEAKVRPGDRVISIDGQLLTRANFATAMYALNVLAPRQTTRLTVRDPAGAERVVTVETKVVPGRQLRSLSSDSDVSDMIREEETSDHLNRQRYAEMGDVLIWKMPSFVVDNTEIDRMIGMARRHATLILDLRDNPGGIIDAMARLVGGLNREDVRLFERVTRKGRTPIAAKGRGSSAFTGKLIVLIDSGSASSSEILARVVQLGHRGDVVGDQSAGAVMEARIYPFAQGDQVMIFYGFAVTDADLIMADRHSLERTGVTPDEVVRPTAADLAAGRDPALARAAALAGLTLDATAAGRMFPFEWRPF
jgi:C-terminal processing protease CtpA/Prc